MEGKPPLEGLTFLNTRDSRSAPQLTEILAERGADVVEAPAIEFIPPESWAPFDRRLEQITPDDWIVFTSANAVRATLERLWELNRPPATLSRANIAVIGLGTANALAARKIKVDLMPGLAQQEALLAVMLATLHRRNKVWIPRAQEAREELVSGLRQEGYSVQMTPVYRTVMPRGGLGLAAEALRTGKIDWMMFTSSSTVRHFFDLLDEETATALRQRMPRVACIGAVTARAAGEAGFHVSVVPTRQDLEGMIDAVVRYVQGGAPQAPPPSGAPGDAEDSGA